MTPEEAADWQAYQQQGDARAYQRLCDRYLPEVRRIVGRMHIFLGDGALEQADLVQAGAIGLIGALERFDPKLNIAFISFAKRKIRGAVYDELRRLDGFSTRSRRQQRRMEKTRRYLQEQFLRLPSEDEMAQTLGLDLEQYRKLQQSLSTVRCEASREQDLSEWVSNAPLQEWLPSSDGLSPAEKFRLVAGQIEKLPERIRIVLGLYYRDGLTLREIAAVLNLTESRVCQMHGQAMEQLQQQLIRIGELFLNH